ncbi:cell division protein FtsW [Rhodovarius crocodyli]|uniref:Probable peptidoglycan glycosyltransferase FtsW n=1 Tax=Rhodovarius crocodyli TaxID=1979269 RepID=A0A437MIJ2_9PROT|nr:putative peptidoglycan glycosyltransferase FtsW [Rhodovarius crocodyli]RVT97459.1 cell division protein FtsW [Rhodovarius crocodyli]
MDVSRTDTSTLGRWWWGVDRWTMGALFLLIIMGCLMALATGSSRMRDLSAAAATFRQLFFPTLAIAIIVCVSLMPVKAVVRFAFLGLAGALFLTSLTLVIGTEIKGGRRWIHLLGQSVQPSEFLKPFLAVCCAWLMVWGQKYGKFVAMLVAVVPVLMAAVLLKQQPDMGMLAVILGVFMGQCFMAGLPLLWVGVGALGAAALGVLAYMFHGHVRLRIDAYLNPPAPNPGSITQEERSLMAFGNGGLWGRGPGEGTVKTHLPDADADFVFAVLGEEYGFIFCLALIGVFGFVVLRGLTRLTKERDPFVALSAAGLLVQFGLQAFINMGSTLRLIPTKGMTLPLVSYGGSSMIGIAFGMGMLLALTRRRHFRWNEG